MRRTHETEKAEETLPVTPTDQIENDPNLVESTERPMAPEDDPEEDFSQADGFSDDGVTIASGAPSLTAEPETAGNDDHHDAAPAILGGGLSDESAIAGEGESVPIEESSAPVGPVIVQDDPTKPGKTWEERKAPDAEKGPHLVRVRDNGDGTFTIRARSYVGPDFDVTDVAAGLAQVPRLQ